MYCFANFNRHMWTVLKTHFFPGLVIVSLDCVLLVYLVSRFPNISMIEV